jgi:hypothetical protein
MRVEIDGNIIQGKVWTDGDAEPGSWTDDYDAGTPINIDFLGPTVRTAGAPHELLFYSIGIDADAPGP